MFRKIENSTSFQSKIAISGCIRFNASSVFESNLVQDVAECNRCYERSLFHLERCQNICRQKHSTH